jgi:uncharacterized protein (DUF1800 family)
VASAPVAPVRTTIALPASTLSEEQRIIHVLNRLGYGPRPGDLERVKQIGLAAYIDRQLDPGRVPDDRLDASLQAFPALTMSVPDLLHGYPEPDPKLLAKAQSGEMSQQEVRQMAPLERRPARIAVELQAAKLTRAVLSERQLQEVMVDFWFNHFNVDARKGAVKWMIADYERTAIRPHALGKFRDLLLATAQHPAMLFYLDNWLSVGPNSDVANGIPKRANNNWKQRVRNNGQTNQSKGKRNGLNENYGRELMELHTLGVNGGYTQQDVTEVARVFTGWTLKQPKQGGGFTFEERTHEPGDKIVLGHRIKPKGEKEGLEVLRILAHHPSTAKFVCTKLAMRFVSDDPPQALVDRMSQTFLNKDGNIREVLKTMLDSPEFWAPDAYRAKMKTPFEFVVSAVRASGADVTDAMPISHQLQNMGMPLYGMQPPTGYSMKADAWVNSSALLGRMNFALALTSGKVKGVQVDSAHIPGQNNDPQQSLAALENSLLAGDVSKQTHDVISARLQDSKISRRKLDDPARPPPLTPRSPCDRPAHAGKAPPRPPTLHG